MYVVKVTLYDVTLKVNVKVTLYIKVTLYDS